MIRPDPFFGPAQLVFRKNSPIVPPSKSVLRTTNLWFVSSFLKKPPSIEMPGGLLHMRKFLSYSLQTHARNEMPMIYSSLAGHWPFYSSFLIQELSAFDTVPFVGSFA